MITCEKFFNILKNSGFIFFSGIPDSTFNDWMKFLDDGDSKILTNIIACNECEAIALCAGYYLSTGKIGIAYMQNSGFSKAINPLVTLCDPEVYSIPILLMIGWRGEPGKTDAIQHSKMGRILLPLLDVLEIPYSILGKELEEIEKVIEKTVEYFNNEKGPYALIIKRNLFHEYITKTKRTSNYELNREDVIKVIMENIDSDDIIVSTTGYTSREVFEYRESKKKDHHKSFYNIGSMGCASSIGLSVALKHPEKRIVIFDGDGSVIMQMGAFTTIGRYNPTNLIHIIFDNNAHESTGGQPTNSSVIDFLKLALASNYRMGSILETKEEIIHFFNGIKNKVGPIIMVIKIKIKSRNNLKRLKRSPKEYKQKFMEFLNM